MPRYEFRCRRCVALGGEGIFEVTRPMSSAREPATCPDGHSDTIKLLSTVAMTGAATSAPAGGCCGGACGCG
ncbi:MAG: zinc ribbon domain-containing protein [Pseudonocardia sp.]|nr:zinc ribbon domain-containing protein [Pseudonocardia sp.]